MKFITEYSLKENFRRKCYFIISFLTCFLVSLVCLVAKTVVSQGTLIFLMLGEKDSGEIDFYITSTTLIRNSSYIDIEDYYHDNSFINFTKYEELMFSEENSKKEANPFNTSTIRTYYNGVSNHKLVYLMLIDTDKERDIELGRSYPYDKLKEGECLVSKSLLVDEQKEFNFMIPMTNFLIDTLLIYFNDNTNKTEKDLRDIFESNDFSVNMNCKIIDSLSNNYGKESDDDNNIIIMEQEYFYKYLSNFVPEIINNKFPLYKEVLKNKIKASDYGNTLIVNFPKNRLNYYTEDDYDNLLDKGVRYMNKVVQKMGTLQYYKVTMPLIKTMNKYKYGTTLLNLILNIILLGIFGLSLILIHSLLLITTETNAFEFGVLRLVGNSKKNIATSLNTMLNKTQGVKVEVISLQKKEFTSLIIFGLLTFIYGASIYYFLPLSLISMNFGMIGAIFLWILFGILLGFVLLSRNIENLLQKILTYILLFFTKSYTKLLIMKNLAAHRLKNKK